jgi:general nucleoside transport system permease protein
MSTEALIVGLAGILAAASPIVFATLGETLTERAGVVNLSLNGTILLSAMASFAVAVASGSLVLGFLTGMLVGAGVALVVAAFSISLKQSQVAVGFVLTLMCRDLSYFLGNPFMGLSGPRLPALTIPLLEDIPLLGPLFFRQDLLTYLSFILIFATWAWIFRTRPGLSLISVGERPAAAYVRGLRVNRMRYLYTIVGGALVGLAGPAFSLSVKAGWKGTISGLDGYGWIALAITIFGGWNPIRAAFGTYLFVFLQWLGLVLQPSLPGVPSQVLQVAPFPLMILALLLVNIGNTEWVERTLAGLPDEVRRFIARVLRSLRASPPAALGVPFEQE